MHLRVHSGGADSFLHFYLRAELVDHACAAVDTAVERGFNVLVLLPDCLL